MTTQFRRGSRLSTFVALVTTLAMGITLTVTSFAITPAASAAGSITNLKTIAGDQSAAGIGELVSAFTTVNTRGGKLKLYNLPDKVADILQVTQLISVFEVHQTEQEAIDSFN